MAHKIIGYFESVDDLIGKTFWLYNSKTYATSITITDITPRSAGTKWAVCVWADNSSQSHPQAGQHNYSLAIIAQLTMACTVTYQSTCKYNGGGGSYEPPPTNPEDLDILVDYGTGTVSLTVPNQSFYLWPYSQGVFSFAFAYYHFLDEEGCPYVKDDSGILNNYGDDAIITNSTLEAYTRSIMAHNANPPKGQGTAILTIPANGASFKFTSAQFGSQTVFIDKDKTINFVDV